MQFDPRKPRLAPLAEVAPMIRDGWLLQYRGAGLISRLIQYGTGGVHSHSAMVRRMPDGELLVMELREFVGGRVRSLAWHVEHYPGCIDLFSPNEGNRWEWEGRRAARQMQRLVDRPYGYVGVTRLALQRVPLLWRLWPLSHDDEGGTASAPFCSHAVCAATKAGGVDPVPRKPDDHVSPNDLTWSLFYAYRCTLTP